MIKGEKGFNIVTKNIVITTWCMVVVLLLCMFSYAQCNRYSELYIFVGRLKPYTCHLHMHLSWKIERKWIFVRMICTNPTCEWCLASYRPYTKTAWRKAIDKKNIKISLESQMDSHWACETTYFTVDSWVSGNLWIAFAWCTFIPLGTIEIWFGPVHY